MSWHKISIDPADILFSKWIRLRDKKCLKCGRRGEGELGITKLQNSHFYGRRKEGTRYDPLNCDSMDSLCHKYFTEHRTEYEAWKLDRLGQKEYDLLMLRANNPVKKDRLLQRIIWKKLLKEDYGI